jgi:tetratricopeptide (TPR) repeat protein
MPVQSPSAGNSILKPFSGWRADWPRVACGAILVAGAIAAYSRTFSVPLLFDDRPAIVDNLTIRHWSTAFWPPLRTTASGRPILNLSLAINYAISGSAVWSYHALNLAIHVLAGLTLFGIVRRTLAPRAGPAGARIAFFAALLWTLHPLQTEAVTYLVQRAESLMGLFYLLTLYGFIRGAEAAGRARSLWFCLCVAACLLGMATKEVMVTAPLIVLLYDRTFVAGSFREAWRRRGGLHVALAATWLPLAGLVASAGWDRNGTSGLNAGITPWAYWLTQFEAVTRYLWLSVWPHPLVFEYGTFWVNRSTDVALYALVVVVLAVAVLVALWRRPALGFLGAWFFVILAPTSVIPGRIQMIVEHRMYLSLAAVMTLAAMGIRAAARRQSWVVFAALALGLGMLTARRNEVYRSELTLWGDTVAKRPNNERAHNNLGLAWSKMPGRLPDAIAEYEEALHLKPDFPEAHNNLGLAWSKMPGRLNDAIAEYEEALRLQPDYAGAYNNLGLVWSKMPGRLKDAIAEFEEALRLQPDYAGAHDNLGLAWSKIPGRLNDAIAQFEEALRLQPDSAEAHNNLGVAWSEIPGRLPDAIAQYEEALRLQPELADAHDNLGVAWSQMPGRLPDAIAEYKEALRLQPDSAEAHNNLGLAWSQMPGRLPDAIAQYEEALRLQPDSAEAHDNLGVAWSQVPGRLPDAIAQYEEALRLKPSFAEAHNNLGLAWSQVPGRLPDAIAQYEEALRLKPDFASGWHNLGVSWFHLGNLPAAAAAFREELRLSPNDPAARQALAAALQQADGH